MLIQSDREGDLKMHQEVKNLSVCFNKSNFGTFWYQIMCFFSKIFQVFLGTLTISTNPYISIFLLYLPTSKHKKLTFSDYFRGDKTAALTKIVWVYKVSLTAIFIEIFINTLIFCSLSITKWILTRFCSFTLAELATRILFNTTQT